ncbi:MAG: histidine kinase [Bacteroidetes bacterium]|nr:histidine kinase [Bacteroidota bacterium]
MQKQFFILFFMVLSSWAINAQEPSVIHLTEKDGLPDIEFYDLFTDSKGFVWLAADKGLYKYDGKTFINYNHPEKRGLSVFNIAEDKNGRIWCKNITGQIFYVQNEKMHLFYDLNMGKYGESVKIDFLENNVVLTGYYMRYIIDFDTKKMEYGKIDFKSSFGGSSFMFKGRCYNTRKDTLLDITNPKKLTPIFSNSNLFVTNDSNEYFQHNEKTFIYRHRNRGNALLLLDIEAKIVSSIHLPQELLQVRWSRVSSLDGYIWFFTSKGIFTYRYENEKLIYVNNFLTSYFPTDATKDKDQNYWISSLDDGVFVIPNINIKKYSLPKEVANIKSLKKYKDGALVMGSFNGSVGTYNPTYQNYTLLDKAPAKISELCYFENKNLLLASNDLGGVIVTSKQIRQHKEFGNLKDVSQINDSTFVVATYNSSTIYTAHSREPWVTEQQLNRKRSYSCFYDASQKSYFVGNTDHLRRFDSLYKEHIILYQGESIFALDMAQTEDNTLWVTTFKHGILGIRNDSVVTAFNATNGLPTNRTSILETQEEYIWAATQEDVAYINTITKEVKVLTQQDGIPSFKINEITVLGNEIFFASNDGLFSVDKNKAFIERRNPQLYVTSITIADKKVDLKQSYDLSYQQNRIKIEFHANGFQVDKNIIYQYQFNDDTDEWISLQNGVREVTFNNLANGAYLFNVRAKNVYSNKVSLPKSIQFTIALPYWQRWWFISLIISATLLIAVAYFKSFQSRKEKEKDLEVAQLQLNNQLTSLKLENLRSQMNPHFIFNALNSIQEYIVLNKKDLASDYLGKFADLVRTYLKHSGKGTISLQEEINCLEMYLELEKLRFEDKLSYKVSKSKNLFLDEIFIPTMLVQPYVENSLKHGLLHKKENCVLTISFEHSSDFKHIICMVRDNGIGREKAKQLQQRRAKNHKSFATKANDDRLQMINQGKDKKIGVAITDLYDANDKAIGTEVTIRIPFEVE